MPQLNGGSVGNLRVRDGADAHALAVTGPRQPDNPIVLANQAFLDLTGYTAEEVVGRNCRFLQGNGTSAETVADIWALVAEAQEFTVEILNYKKSGVAFWNQLHRCGPTSLTVWK